MEKQELDAMRDELLTGIKKMMMTTGQVTQYIGSRYVPLFANPIEWDGQREYEPLTVVQYQGDSYTSRQFVPKGIRIADAHYWALTGNYNAQIEQYRDEVKTFDERIEQNKLAIEAEAARASTAESTKAPINHSSEDDIYGAATDVKYGHVKLVDSLTDGSEGKVAASANLIGKVRRFNYPFTDGGLLLNFGDSIAAGSQSTTSYAKICADKFNLTIMDYAVGGATISPLGTGAQVTRAIKEVSDKESVKVIFYEGGVNNTYNTNDSFPYEQAVTDLTTLKQNFPHAFILVLPMVWSAYPFANGLYVKDKQDNQQYNTSGANRTKCLYALTNAAYDTGVLCFDNIYECNIGFRDRFVNFIHPNEKGHGRLASWIVEKLMGGNPSVTLDTASDPAYIDAGEYFDIYQFSISCVNSVVTIRGCIKCKKTIPANTLANIYIPSWAAFSDNNSTMLPIFSYSSKKLVTAWTTSYDEHLRGVISIINSEQVNVDDLLIFAPITYKIGCL